MYALFRDISSMSDMEVLQTDLIHWSRIGQLTSVKFCVSPIRDLLPCCTVRRTTGFYAQVHCSIIVYLFLHSKRGNEEFIPCYTVERELFA